MMDTLSVGDAGVSKGKTSARQAIDEQAARYASERPAVVKRTTDSRGERQETTVQEIKNCAGG